MTATIKPAGMLKTYLGGQETTSVEPGQTVHQALQFLGIPPEIVALVMVGEEVKPKDYCLQDGDVVRLIAVIGGG